MTFEIDWGECICERCGLPFTRKRGTAGRFCNRTCYERDVILRFDQLPEEIEMHAHSAACRYCEGGIVKMKRGEDMKLQPDNCYCLQCGQRYFVLIHGDIDEWERQQWEEKAQR